MNKDRIGLDIIHIFLQAILKPNNKYFNLNIDILSYNLKNRLAPYNQSFVKLLIVVKRKLKFNCTMKKLYPFLFLCLSMSVQAQTFQKGTWLVGVQATYGRSYLDRANQWLIPQAYIGAFMANSFLVGIRGTYFEEHSENLLLDSKTYALGPMLRYQITQTRLSPYVTASFLIGQSKLTGPSEVIGSNGMPVYRLFQSPTRTYSRSLGTGISIRVFSGLRVDAGIDWQDFVDTPNLNVLSWNIRTQAQLGLTYLFDSSN